MTTTRQMSRQLARVKLHGGTPPAKRPTDRPAPSPRMLTAEEVATELRMHRLSIYRLIRKGTIPAVKVGGRLLIPAAELDRLLTVR